MLLKKILSFFLALVLSISVFSGEVFSEEVIRNDEFQSRKNFEAQSSATEQLSDYVDLDVFKAYLLDQFASCEDYFPIDQFEIPYSKEMWNSLVRYIWKDLPEAFHVGGIGCERDVIFEKLHIIYNETAHDYVEMMYECEDAAVKILKGIAGNSVLSQAEKALLIHDRLATWCEYDMADGEHRYDMYGVLVDRSAVCEGYAQTYLYLLNKIGIENYYCSSDLLNHAWNIVTIDGEIYHVDITWDDKTPDMPGRVYHENFLRSTAGIISTGHSADGGLDYDVAPSSSLYDNAYWQTSSAAFQLIGNDLYYLDHDAEYLCKVGESENLRLYSIDDIWRTKNGYYSGNFAKLSSHCLNLIFSLSDAVYSYNVKSGAVTLIFKPALSPGECIYGLQYDGERMNCFIGTSPNKITRTATKAYEVPEEEHDFSNPCDISCDTCGLIRTFQGHSYDNACDPSCNLCGNVRDASHRYAGEHDMICNVCGYDRSEGLVMIGDLNDDKTVNSDDAIYLLYHTLFGEDRYPINQNCDFNSDDLLSSEDAIYLLYHTLFGENRYPLL